MSSPIKTPKDLEKYVAELAPALLSVEWSGSQKWR